jgi:hypothetical protein
MHFSSTKLNNVDFRFELIQSGQVWQPHLPGGSPKKECAVAGQK